MEYKIADVYKPAKGLFQHTMYRTEAVPPGIDIATTLVGQTREKDFYVGVAEYLTEDLEECTKCIALGGCAFKD